MSKARIRIVGEKTGFLKALLSLVGLSSKGYQCLFNPKEFSIQRSVNYAEHQIPGLDRPIMQYVHGGGEVMRFSLFFDVSSGEASSSLDGTSEVASFFTNTSSGASMGAGGLFESASDSLADSMHSEVMGSALRFLNPFGSPYKKDIRKYTDPFYKLLDLKEDQHMPSEVVFEWGSIKFQGYVTDIEQKFTKFLSSGTPVQAILDITIKSSKQDSYHRNSPDRTKHHLLESGDRLYAIATKEYGDCSEWRRIAEANQIDNPRLLRSGESIVIPPIL